jgi:hypothetical protein
MHVLKPLHILPTKFYVMSVVRAKYLTDAKLEVWKSDTEPLLYSSCSCMGSSR